MNIHYNPATGQRIDSGKARGLGLTVGSSKGTDAPRTRAGKAYPGGRSLRRSLSRLNTRRTGEQGPGHCQPDSHRGSQANYATVPGSMTR